MLVTGGAGYIGSHALLSLLEAGHNAVVIDNLTTGNRWAVPDDTPFIRGEVADLALVRRTLSEHKCDTIMHFAAMAVVDESMREPLQYYDNNVGAFIPLVRAATEAGVERFIFSSTAAAYGEPDQVPVSEGAPLAPINPYGASKVMCEQILRDACSVCDMKYGILRYFNVAGADPLMRVGQAGPASTHLIRVASQAASGKLDGITIFGTDYPTEDGTCIRDYIHVTDLTAAHLSVLDYLVAGGSSDIFNCGYGHGYSVKEVLAAAEDVYGSSLGIETGPRRPGDPPELVADVSRITEKTGWRPAHNDLSHIIRTAMEFERVIEARRNRADQGFNV